MSALPKQILTLVVRPVLEALSLGGQPAEMLLMGTAAKESDFRAIKQIGGGPALSLWQIEPATARDAFFRSTANRRNILGSMAALWPQYEDVDVGEELLGMMLGQLPGSLYIGAAMCRLVYHLKPFSMPTGLSAKSVMDIETLGHIWKINYNTAQGAGTVKEFMDAWDRNRLSELWP